MGMGDLPRAGRPSFALNNDDAIDIITACMLDRQGPTGMAARLKAELRLEVSPETVRRFVKRYMGRPLRAIKKPLLKETHKKDRLRFAKRWVRRDWSNVVVTDSKYFWLCPRGAGPKWWVPYGMDADYVPAEKNCQKVHVYAGVSRWGRTRLFVTVGTTGLKAPTKGVNGEVYKELLENKLIPACKEMMAKRNGRQATRKNWIFQQDNARAHTSQIVIKWLRAQDFDVMEWPSKSPDLSWIETMWGYVSKQLSKRTDLTKENFIGEVEKAWDSIPDNVHSNMYNSIKTRLNECIDANGGMTRY
jgi:hypothetical protein